MIGNVWSAVWPNMVAPSIWTLFGILIAHLHHTGLAKRQHAQQQAQAHADHLELKAQAAMHHKVMRQMAEKNQQDLLDRADANHEALKAYIAAPVAAPKAKRGPL